MSKIKLSNRVATFLKFFDDTQSAYRFCKDRRFYKDRVEEIKALAEFAKDPANAKAINMLKQALGQMRKEDAYHEKREYWPRSADPELQRLFWQPA